MIHTQISKNNNALFNPKLIKKAINTANVLINGEIPDKYKKIIERRLSNQAIHKKAKELEQSHDFLVFFKELLGYKSVGDQTNAKTWDVVNELKGIDYALGEFSKTDKKVIVPFEFKSPKTYDLTRPIDRRESTVEQAIRYAANTEGTAKWFLVSNCIEFRLYKFPESTRKYEQWFLEDLIKPEEYARFVLLLKKENLLGGATEKLFNDSQQQEKEITDQLYRDYRQLRIDLINGLKKENNSIRRKAMVRIGQKLLDRILFIAFAEDRDLLPNNTLHNRIFEIPNAVFSGWESIKKLFADIDKGNPKFNIPAYNGGLFAADIELESLNISDELLKKFKVLYDYDFDNDIGTPILGHIFEQSIADLDEIYENVSEEQELQSSAKATSTSGKRKQDGIVYTPEFITDYIIEQTLGGYLKQRQANITHEHDSAAYWFSYREILAHTRVLDPACGSGAFLIGAFAFLKSEYDYVNRRIQELAPERHTELLSLDLDADILNNNLFGVDLNPESIEITQLALWLETAERGKKLKPLDKNIQQGNSIIHHKNTDKQAFLWNVQFNKVMEAGGFDVVLGNPPYVRQERLSDIKPYLQEHYQTYHGVADLYTYFFELGLKLLKKGGRLGYISSSTFFRTNSGEALREFLKVRSNLLTVIDFNDYPVFEGVTTYPAILILEKPERMRKNAPKSEFKFLNITAKKEIEHQAVKQQLQNGFGVMKQASLKTDAWQLEDESFSNLRQKITQGYKTLKEVYDSPYRGVLTGLNEAFVIDAQQYQLLKQDDPDGKILKPFLEGKDLKRWRAESRSLYLIFTRRGVEIDNYPLIKAYLAQFKERLEPKPDDYPKNKTWVGRKAGKYEWYEIQDVSAYYTEFEKEKIVWGNLQSSPSFLYDDQKYFINAPSPFLATTEKWLVAYLNSSLVWFFLHNIAIGRSGGFIECKPMYINQIPIPSTLPEQKLTLADLAEQCQTLAKKRYELEQKVQRRFLENFRPANNNESLNTKLTQWWNLSSVTELAIEVRKAFKLKASTKLNVDFSNPAIQDTWESYLQENISEWQTHTQKIQNLEKQIDDLVYALFDLSDEEKKRVKS